MKKNLFVFFLFFLFFTNNASAHVGGGPPFLEINGKYAPTNPFFSNDPTINIPQDVNPETEQLVVNEPIVFTIDTSKLLVPPDVAAASTFRWTMDENSNEHLFGKNFTYAYKKAGSHLITLEAKGPGETEFLVIDTTQVDILPNKSYVLPKTAIAVATDKRDSAKPLFFTSTIKTDHTAKVIKIIWGFGDGQNSAELNPHHLYQNTANYATFPVVFRVVDNHGFTRDAGIIVQARNGKFSFIDVNGREDTIKVTNSITPTKSIVKNPSSLQLFIYIFFAIGIAVTMIMIIKLRFRNK